MEKSNDYSVRLNNRVFIEVLRGITVFLMLWGHCIQYCCGDSYDFFNNPVFKIIYSFHMPLFMLISGYLFFFSAKKRSLKELLIHRTQSMLQPIIMCGMLCFLMYDVVVALATGTYMMLFTGPQNHFTDYWFLWSVLSSSVVVGIACKITNKKWLSALILVIGIPFVAVMPCGEMNLYMYPYFVLGFIIAACTETAVVRKLSPAKYLSLILFPIMMLFYRKEHYIYTSGFFGEEGLLRHMPTNLFRWAIGLVGSVFVITVLELIFRLSYSKISNLKITAQLKKIGNNSLQIYVLSCIFLSRYLPEVYCRITDYLGYNILMHNMTLYNFIYTPLLAAAYSAGLLFLTRILRKIKADKILFGR